MQKKYKAEADQDALQDADQDADQDSVQNASKYIDKYADQGTFNNVDQWCRPLQPSAQICACLFNIKKIIVKERFHSWA